MSDTTGQEPEGGKPEYTPPATQEELNRIIAERVAREKAKYADYNDLKAKAAEYDKLAEAQKTEQQKLIERAEAAEKALAAKQSEALRLSVIAKHQIPEDYHDFIVGDSEEDLNARAEKVKSLISSKEQPLFPPKADPTQGKQTPGKGSTADQFAEQMTAAGF